MQVILFERSKADVMIIGLCVDDSFLASNNQSAISSTKSKVSEMFEMKDLGDEKHCLRLQIS